MKYMIEFRTAEHQAKLIKAIEKKITQPWTIMEICGGQTHAIAKYGLQEILPKEIELVHGPGCPVCVTPIEMINHALELAKNPDIIMCSFGDMLRVPGSEEDLLSIKAKGGDIRMMYSPLEAIKLATDNPDKEVVFFAVGFETTVPSYAMAILKAAELKLNNFSLLCALVQVPPAIKYLLEAPNTRIQGFLAAGHVCAIMGYQEYISLAETFKTPIIVTGFEPVDVLKGVLSCVTQLEDGKYEVENQYGRCVSKEGNLSAQRAVAEIFEVTDQLWRGIGNIPKSGLNIKEKYQEFDAKVKFPISKPIKTCPSVCISGEILQGLKKPFECNAFGKSCTPETPKGAPMVSTEGACAAYYRYVECKATTE